ncbi:hypothetical protein NHX12_014038 [Muraenolepis orangiensis]|uniref:Uncharacterized protein n=1 Tax=Muraenolepis orangiensis TaxID=630683 RepID=A0A9Q0DES9_9TELE|nr:hypothetical protein NHX12_014038 [Muraenolepis orangiensis]
MGCRCCRMIKSYIYDPSAGVEVRKSEGRGSDGEGSLYRPQSDPSGGPQRKEGLSNPGYSKSNEGTLKLEADNNHVNRLAVREHSQQGAPPRGDHLYIIQPQAPGPTWDRDTPSRVPVYPDPLPAFEDEDEDEGVGGTPDPCDTGDEGSESDDGHTPAAAKMTDASTAESGISVMKSEDEEEEEEEEGGAENGGGEDVRSVTDSMVAEALAALEAATAGEDDD